ncbi:MAG: hypothetical protein A3F46_02400 [Legionellales bacterium RIFCSPHIGHO2_12_FULL_42_9]|nr:MAG: hypothetical protein A3F46_02400 [Legionellales bacterium RIFCSPHIGHO2_12_FULL_42_9]
MSGKQLFVLGLCWLGLSACDTTHSGGDYSYETSGGYYGTSIDSNVDSSSAYTYNSSYDNYSNYQEAPVGGEGVAIPQTYHVGTDHAPVPAKDRDRTWISEQNPQGYTIEIADGDKAAQVANKLVQAPKKERTAEVQYFRDGGQYYKGLYGSYSTEEAAKQALDALPDNLKQQAGVKSWRDVQGAVGE